MDDLERARELVAGSSRIVVLTGAGISTDSGIPDFRGPNGVWTKNPGAEKQATLSHYVSDPDVRKASWQTRLSHPAWEAKPNAGHDAIVELERQGKLLAVLTQNVDGLHLLAGTSPELLVEVHGSMREVECLQCHERAPMERALARVRAGEEDPPCRTCGGILKSATISFGQSLVATDLQRADEVARSCDLMLTVGTTLGVYPIAGVVPIAKRSGAHVVIVNGEPTEMDELADVVLRRSISEVLPALVRTGA
jgi:NAD-dependent deacetylase